MNRGLRGDHAEREQLRVRLGANVLHQIGELGFGLEPLPGGEQIPLHVLETEEEMQDVTSLDGQDGFHVRTKFPCRRQKNNCNPGSGS